MKKTLTLLLALLMCFSLFAACGTDEPADTSMQSGQNQPEASKPEKETDPPETTAPVVEELASAGDLGDFSVEIGEFELARDYDGNPAILISYAFTNHSEESTSAIVNMNCIAYQNGVELDSAFIYDHESYDSENSMKEIQPGATIEVMEAYVLTSETAPVEFEITESFSFDDQKLGKTFALTDDTTITLNVAPEGNFTAEIGDYVVSIVSHRFTEDYEGAPALLIELGFTNNGNEPSFFASSVSFQAFQDGIELESAYISGDDSGSGISQMRHVKPGAGTTVTVAFVLTSTSSPVSIEIEDFFSFSGETINTEIVIAD